VSTNGKRRTAESGATAAQHLLRHLDDPAGLRANALVGPLFEQVEGGSRTSTVLGKVQDLVGRCAEQLRTDADGPESRERRERQYRILTRCDLGSEQRDAVAADLGLSRRQFYRERKEASEYLARFVAEYVRERLAQTQHVRLDRFALEVARAKALRLAGEAPGSERVLRDLIASANGFVSKVEPWCNLIDLLVNDNRSAEARSELEQLRKDLANASDLPREAAIESRARVDMQVAGYLWYQGRMREALALDERAEGDLAAMARSLNPAAREFFVKARIRQAICGLMIGTLEQARLRLEEARAMLVSDDLPLALRIEFLIIYGSLKEHAGGSDEAMPLVGEALNLARRHGLVELVIDAVSGLSSTAQVRGDHVASKRFAYDILPVAEQSGLAMQQGVLLNVAAISEASLGKHEAAVDLARRARAVLSQDSLESIYSSLAEAQASVTIRDFGAASGAAQAAYAAASGIRSDRLGGTALRLLAESAAGLGHAQEAQERIVGAIAALEREGPPFALLQAYQAAAKITGDRRFRRTAAELAAALAR
jgi:hypothetical protein